MSSLTKPHKHIRWSKSENLIQDDLQPFEIAECYGTNAYNKYTINFDCTNAAAEVDLQILMMHYWYDIAVVYEAKLDLKRIMGVAI